MSKRSQVRWRATKTVTVVHRNGSVDVPRRIWREAGTCERCHGWRCGPRKRPGDQVQRRCEACRHEWNQFLRALVILRERRIPFKTYGPAWENSPPATDREVA